MPAVEYTNRVFLARPSLEWAGLSVGLGGVSGSSTGHNGTA
jgi:hypothetical protein